MLEARGIKPYAHGFTKSTIADANGMIVKPRLHLGDARTLRELQREYVFFTPALLYLALGQRMEMLLIDFVHQFGAEVKFLHHRFDVQIFNGLLAPDGDAAWNSVLWAVRRPFWLALQGFLCSVTLTWPERRLVLGIGYQEFNILDPLAVDKHRVVVPETGLLPVGAFGINGNRYIFAFALGDPHTTMPSARRHEPASDMSAFATALFAGKNPADARLDAMQKVKKEERRHGR